MTTRVSKTAPLADNEATPIPKEFELLHKFWKASNYLAVGQIYLLDKNPLLRRPLELSDVKIRLLGHFGTTPGQNFIYVHLNRLIKEKELQVIYISGPGHGGPALVAQTYMEGTYTEYYPQITQDMEGMGHLFKQFSFPGGIPSHVAPETPGSMHEGGELGYSLSHAFGAVLDKPELMIACVVGDGEAETGPLATSWHANKYLNPRTDGVVLPILHLNGYKIANPCILARIPEAELKALFVGYGYEPLIVEGSDPGKMHPAFAKILDYCAEKIAAIQKKARETPHGELMERPTWPMIILRSPKGWTGPKIVDGKQIEDSYRAHQVPMSSPATNKDHLVLLEEWLKSYEPETLFDEQGRLLPELQELVPERRLRMGANPFANPQVKPLVLPDFADYAVPVDVNARGKIKESDTYVTGTFLRDVIRKNEVNKNFRMFGPDETASNRLHAVFEATSKQWMGEYLDTDDDTLAQYGRVMEMLSEHQCEGWLEGYLLTGGHGLLNSY
jgi:xylulose-5-phosphate/fructose-6-phosphate phosphoketolase